MPTTRFAREQLRALYISSEVTVYSAAVNFKGGYDVRARIDGYWADFTIASKAIEVAVPNYVPTEWEKVS